MSCHRRRLLSFAAHLLVVFSNVEASALGQQQNMIRDHAQGECWFLEGFHGYHIRLHQANRGFAW